MKIKIYSQIFCSNPTSSKNLLTFKEVHIQTQVYIHSQQPLPRYTWCVSVAPSHTTPLTAFEFHAIALFNFKLPDRTERKNTYRRTYQISKQYRRTNDPPKSHVNIPFPAPTHKHKHTFHIVTYCSYHCVISL